MASEPQFTQILPKIHFLSIHIPNTEQEDKLIWPLSKNGEYSVKTVYFVAQLTDGRDQQIIFNWKKLWALKFPPKYSLFIWKVIHGILAVKDTLLKRKVDVCPLCPRCSDEIETIEHLFLRCRNWKMV